MKKLLIATGIYPPDIGGPATYAKLLADHFGADAMVVTYSPLLRKVPTPLRQLIYLLNVWSASRQANVIYSLSPLGTGIASALVARWRRRKFFVRVAGDRAWEDAVNAGRTHLLLDDYQKLNNRGIKHKLQTWVCKKAQAVIVPSEYLVGIVAGWGIPREKIYVVANSVNLPRQGGVSKEQLRKELGIHGNLIVSIGRLVPWKGFRMLIKIMPQLLKINQFFRLVIVGDGPDMPTLQAMVKNLSLQGKVYLVGRKSPEDANRYLCAADLFMLNTGYEGFSHQLLETMMQGVPIITTNIGGNRELLRQGEDAFMVKYNDEFNLVEAVRTLWQSPELREKFIENGKKTAARYTVEKMMTKTLDVLNLE